MENRNGQLALKIFIQVFVFLVIGIILLGSVVVRPSNSLFTFTLYGFSAVIFYYLMVNKGLKGLIIGGLFLVFILNVLFSQHFEILHFVRNLLWYILIGIMAFFISRNEKDKPALYIVASWFAGFILVYIIMILTNIYVFSFYKLNEYTSVMFYILQAVKIGGVLGAGVGLGKILADFLFQEKLDTAKSE
ncbi:MAG: hypothetical protein HF300_16270 [Ignavibacteria bacterium]|jgi:hypothetical protein|nr:hypothetical protein [Ignavibacteria bacterium]MCU7514116.1 hypothetical protein [Ignavibacteria bacterium]